MKMRRQLFVLVMALVIASPILAAEKKKAAKKAPACPAAQAVERMTKGMTISDEQKATFRRRAVPEPGGLLREAARRWIPAITPPVPLMINVVWRAPRAQPATVGRMSAARSIWTCT